MVGTCNWEDAEEVLADLVIWSSLETQAGSPQEMKLRF
jgi:hypothetical protein